MTTSLLQRPTSQLELLLWSRQLQKARFDEVAALRFVSNALVALRDAKGIYAQCLGTIYLHGLLPREQEGSRAMAIQLAFELLELTIADLQQMLLANRLLEDIAGRANAPMAERTVKDLVALGDRAVDQAKLIYPDCFF